MGTCYEEATLRLNYGHRIPESKCQDAASFAFHAKRDYHLKRHVAAMTAAKELLAAHTNILELNSTMEVTRALVICITNVSKKCLADPSDVLTVSWVNFAAPSL